MRGSGRGLSPGQALLATAGLYPGLMRGRSAQVVKNGRWYLSIRGAPVAKIGWGDLAWEDL